MVDVSTAGVELTVEIGPLDNLQNCGAWVYLENRQGPEELDLFAFPADYLDLVDVLKEGQDGFFRKAVEHVRGAPPVGRIPLGNLQFPAGLFEQVAHGQLARVSAGGHPQTGRAAVKVAFDGTVEEEELDDDRIWLFSPDEYVRLVDEAVNAAGPLCQAIDTSGLIPSNGH